MQVLTLFLLLLFRNSAAAATTSTTTAAATGTTTAATIAAGNNRVPVLKQKKKRGRGSQKKSPIALEIDPEFALKKPGVYSKTNILNIHPNLPGKWVFNLGSRVVEIDNLVPSQHPGDNFKYYILGHRNGHSEKISELHQSLVIQVPRFVVHAVPVDSPDINCITFQGHEMLITGDSPFAWKNVGQQGLPIKLLVSTVRQTSRSLQNTANQDGELFTDGHLWWAQSVDFKQNPLEDFKVQVAVRDEVRSDGDGDDYSGGVESSDDLFVDSFTFKHAHQSLMKAFFANFQDENPGWDDGLEDEEKKQFRMQKKIEYWNGIFMEEDLEEWMTGMMKSGLLNIIRAHWEESHDFSAAVLDDLWEDTIIPEFERALRVFKPQQQEQAMDWRDLGESTTRALHFKIYPENDELKPTFLNGDIGFINAYVGKAHSVFPKPLIPAQDA